MTRALSWIRPLGRRLVGPRVSGQIGLESEIGRWITLLSSLASVKEIVEIGTWRGNGSTRCVADGIKLRRDRDVRALCLEIDNAMAFEASRRWRSIPEIRVEWGRITDFDDLDQDHLTNHEIAWFEKDVALLESSPNIFEIVPESIDLLVLDGGEFSTYAEFRLLRERVSQWIVLDDTQTRKGAQILKEIRAGHFDFSLVFESCERNGVAVVARNSP